MSERSIAAGYASSAILALGMDQAQVTALLVEPVEGTYRLVAWHTLPLMVQDGSIYHPLERLALACRQLGRRLGRPLWQISSEGPYLDDPEPALGLGLGHVVAVADPLPPLRAWIFGLSAGESLAAAQEAISAAPCQAVALCRLNGDEDIAALRGELAIAAPDVVIVCGGYDTPGQEAGRPVLAICDVVAQAVRHLRTEERPPLYFAGNRWAASTVLERWRSIPGLDAHAVLNVLPARDVVHTSSLAVALSQHYWSRCRAEADLQQLSGWITSPAAVRSFQWSFAQATRLWCEVQNLRDLHALYCGPTHWMHVWSSADETAVRVRITPPDAHLSALDDWPPVQLVSGPWPEGWARPARHWHEPLGVLPVAAAIGQVNADAVMHLFDQDLIRGS